MYTASFKKNRCYNYKLALESGGGLYSCITLCRWICKIFVIGMGPCDCLGMNWIVILRIASVCVEIGPVERKVRQPGIEPGSTAWKATMLTFTPPTLADGGGFICQALPNGHVSNIWLLISNCQINRIER